jgi:iron complex outermembrane receptor protein
MPRITRVTGFFPLALFLATPSARANETVVLPTIDIDGPASANGSLSVPSVAAQRRALDQTVGSVGYVDADTPEQKTRARIDLRDSLKDVPGVFVESRYGQELRVSIRGAGITRGFHLRGIELLQDGIPFNSADGSGDFYQVDPTFFRTIEVYKGGNALAFGTTTLGGAIDFISPTAYTASAPDIVEVDGGSFGLVRGSVQASRVIGPWDALVAGTFTRSDGFRQHEKQDYQQANGNIGYRFSQGLETRFYWGVYNTNQQLPGQLTLGAALSNPTAAAASAASTGVGGNQSRNELVERIANRTTLALADGRLDIDSWFIHKSLNHPIFQVLDQDGFTAGLAPRWTLGGTIGGVHDDLIFGARAVGGRNAAKQYVNINGQEQAQTLNARQDAVNLEAYAENRFFVLPTVGLMTGAKVFSDQRQYTDFGGLPASPTPKFDSVTYNGINPKVGLIWLPKPDIQVFADLTGSRDVPDFTDLTQTTASTTRFVPLAAQRALTAEIGTRGRYDRLTWDVTAYRSDVHDELLQFTTNQSIPAATFNTPHTLHQGIEFGAGVDVLRNLVSEGDAVTLSQIWNYSDFRFQGDATYGNNQIAGVPRNVLRTTLGYRGMHGLYVAPTVDWVPQGAFVDYANTLRVPGYALLGLQAGVTLAPGVSVYVDARNLTNARYVSDLSTITDARTASTAVFYPGVGRSVYGGMRYAF